MQDIKPLYEAILEGREKDAEALTREAVQSGVDPTRIVKEGVIPAMAEAGRRFECTEFFVPDLLLASRAMKAALRILGNATDPLGRVVIGTVKGDLHDIGKNLVAALLEGAGFEVIDLGYNVQPEQFVKAVQDKNANVVALSALLTTTMGSMRLTIDALKQAGIRDRVKVLVGGAPITQKFADEIGADGYGDNAAEAVTVARRCLAV
ncbi:MAG TPA: corrinoid protein [Verrucomicrobiota bacterium]|nr:corrinoid protein [Verrucomicrobiota bacterium]HNU49961.1 corrinoid protein [Verrucomicrobiota bacterium]